MKHFAAIATAVLMSALPTAALALVGGPTLTAQTSASTVQVGQEFTVTVMMDTKSYNVTAAELHVSFPSGLVKATWVEEGSFLPTVLLNGSYGTSDASITVGSGVTPKNGTGPVMQVTFTALSAGTANIVVDEGTQVSASGEAGDVVGTRTPVTVTISGAQATASAQASSSPAAVNSPAAASSTPAASPTGVVAGASRTPTPRPSSAAQTVSRVSTGPIETTLIAIILGSIGTLLYVGYMGSDAFRRGEARSIAAQERKHESDFRDTV